MNKPAERVVSSEATRSAAVVRAIGSGSTGAGGARAGGRSRRSTEDLATVDKAEYLGERHEYDFGCLHLVRLRLAKPLGAEREEHVSLDLDALDLERLPEVIRRER